MAIQTEVEIVVPMKDDDSQYDEDNPTTADASLWVGSDPYGKKHFLIEVENKIVSIKLDDVYRTLVSHYTEG